MKLLRNGARYLLLAMVILSGLLSTASAAYAQGEVTSFVSPMTGIPINTTGPWTIDTTSLVSQDGVESITAFGEFEFMQVWFLPGNVPLVEARDVVLDSYAQTFGSFVEIDRGAYGNVSYSLDITSSEGIEFGVFSLFLGQRNSGYVEYYVFFGSISLFAQGFASAQQNVRVNNTPVFEGVDGVGLQNLLLQNAGVTGATGSTTTTQAPPPPAQPTQPPADQGQTAPPPAQPTQPPAQPPADTGQTGTTASPEGQAYLAALDAELTYLQGLTSSYMANFTLQNEAQAQELNRIGDEWANYQNRAAGIIAPPGYEAIDAQYRELVGNVTNLGVLWQDVLTAVRNDDGTFGTKMVDLTLQVTMVDLEISGLKTTIASQGSGTTTGTAPQPTQDATTTTPPQPTPPPADTGTTGTTGASPEQTAYIDSIRAETARLQTSIDDFTTKFGSLGDGTSPNPEQTAQEIATIVEMWVNMPQTATQFVAPVGLEDVDAAYKQLANDFATAGTTFNTALQQQGAGDTNAQTTFQTFVSQVEGLRASITSLNSLLDQKAQSTQSTTTQQTTPPQPTQPPADTGTTGTTGTTGSPEGDAYLASLSTEIGNLRASFATFDEGLELVARDDQASIDQGNAQINEAINYWAKYETNAAAIVAPAGYESIDAQYRQLASEVPLLTEYIIAVFEGQDQAARDQAGANYRATRESVLTQLDSLEAAIGGASTGSTGTTGTTTNTPAEPTQPPADTGQTTTQTPTEPAGGSTDVTETGNRGQLPNTTGNQGDTGNTGNTPDNSDLEDLGLVEEGVYVSPQFDVEVTWDDRFGFDPEYLDVTIASDEAEGTDFITLVWTGGEGDITVTIMEAGDFDPDGMVEFWESDDYLGNFESGAEVLLSEATSDRAGVLILVGDADNGTVVYREAFCVDRQCSQVAMVMVISSIDDAADIIADAEEAVEVEGEGSTGVFSTREISRALP